MTKKKKRTVKNSKKQVKKRIIHSKKKHSRHPKKEEHIQGKKKKKHESREVISLREIPKNYSKKEKHEENKKKHILPRVKKIEHHDEHKVLEKLESYEVESEGAKVKVEILKESLGIVYELNIPEVDIATSAFLEDIRNELISITTVRMTELTDPTAFNTIKKRFVHQATKLIKKKLPNIAERTEKFLVSKLIQEMLGLGEIEFLVSDPSLEEIVIPSAKEPIRVYSKKYGWLETNIKIGGEEKIINYSNIIARRVGRQINVLAPLLDAHLVTGDRINAVLYPINTKGNTITIRKFARDPFTIVDLIKNKTCDLETAALLWLAIEFEMNILISGGTGSGKTSFLNALLAFMPPNQRIISIEDTRELMLPEFLYWTPLVTRMPNPEGKGEVSMLDLLVNSLRMRPDRIILGEMRKKQEATVLFEAMHTGHAVYATVHADSAPETISRLINPPLNVPPNLLKAVNLNVVMFRDRKRGIRRILQLAEFEAEQSGAISNILYRWSPEEDSIKKFRESTRFFEDLNRHTGMSESEIKSELDLKKKIITWMIKNEIRDLENLGKVINMYYKNKELLLKYINSNNKDAILQSR